MRYSPALVEEVARGTRDELQRISAALHQQDQSTLPRLANAPQRPREGMLVLCDGANWDPLGDGESQPVWYDGSGWQPLGSATASPRLLGWFLQ